MTGTHICRFRRMWEPVRSVVASNEAQLHTLRKKAKNPWCWSGQVHPTASSGYSSHSKINKNRLTPLPKVLSWTRFGKKHRPTSGPSTLVVPKSFPNESGLWPQKLFCPFCVTIPGDPRLRFWQK
jgi:hypothetical protein